MSKDPMRCLVSRRADLTSGIALFELSPEPGRILPAFTAGSHIKVETPAGQLRSYSLTNDECETHRYVIAVQREEDGRGGSASMHRDVHSGSELMVHPPENSFCLGDANRSLFIAGGIGITPIMSMIRKVQRQRHSDWQLLYLARNKDDAAFLPDLLAADIKDKVTLHFSDDAGFADLWPYLSDPAAVHLYYCGPKPLMDAIYGLTVHWPRSHVHFEEFAGTVSAIGNRPFKVRRAKSGEIVEIPADASIVEVFRQKGYKPKSSCETGTCRTCMVPLLAGEPDHRDLCLTKDEQKHSFSPCVSRAFSDEITLDM